MRFTERALMSSEVRKLNSTPSMAEATGCEMFIAPFPAPFPAPQGAGADSQWCVVPAYGSFELF